MTKPTMTLLRTDSRTQRSTLQHRAGHRCARPLSQPWMSDLITPWFYQFCWGFSSVPAADENREAEMKGYAQALCNAISGDGTASEAEVCVAMMPGVAFHSQPQNCCPRIAYIIAYASRCHGTDQMGPGILRHQGVWKACPRGRDYGEVVGGKADRCYHQGD